MKRQKHEAIEQAQYRAEEDAERKPAERVNKYYILSGEGTGEGRWHSVRATPSTVAWMLKRERCGGDRWARAFLLLANRTDGTGYDIESGDLRDLRGIIHNQ